MKTIQKISTTQYVLLFFYILTVLSVFLFLFIHHTPQFIDKRYIKSCKSILQYHTILIQQTGFNPPSLQTRICDEITFINKDKIYHEVAFGDHPYHLIYPGYNEKALAPDTSITIVLKAYGRYKFHDHLHEKLDGSLNISEK